MAHLTKIKLNAKTWTNLEDYIPNFSSTKTYEMQNQGNNTIEVCESELEPSADPSELLLQYSQVVEYRKDVASLFARGENGLISVWEVYAQDSQS